MTPQQVARELEKVRSRARPLVLTSNYKVDGGLISWYGYAAGITAGVNYWSEYRKCVDGRQYSFLLSGGGALQFYYRFHHGRLVAARQSFLPPPVGAGEDEFWREYEPGLDELLWVAEPGREDEGPGGAFYRAHCWSHVRFDFDENARTHEQSHLQAGAVNQWRLPSQIILSPFAFLVLIMQSFYKEDLEAMQRKAWYSPDLRQSIRASLPSELHEGTWCFLAVRT